MSKRMTAQKYWDGMEWSNRNALVLMLKPTMYYDLQRPYKDQPGSFKKLVTNYYKAMRKREEAAYGKNPKKRLRKKKFKSLIASTAEPAYTRRLLSKYGKTKEVRMWAGGKNPRKRKKKSKKHTLDTLLKPVIHKKATKSEREENLRRLYAIGQITKKEYLKGVRK